MSFSSFSHNEPVVFKFVRVQPSQFAIATNNNAEGSKLNATSREIFLQFSTAGLQINLLNSFLTKPNLSILSYLCQPFKPNQGAGPPSNPPIRMLIIFYYFTPGKIQPFRGMSVCAESSIHICSVLWLVLLVCPRLSFFNISLLFVPSVRFLAVVFDRCLT